MQEKPTDELKSNLLYLSNLSNQVAEAKREAAAMKYVCPETQRKIRPHFRAIEEELESLQMEIVTELERRQRNL
jgi:hypothetical protein